MSDHPVRVRVTDFRNAPIEGAVVSVGRETAMTDSRGSAELASGMGPEIRVEASGYEPQARALESDDRRRVQLFTLGHPGMPTYQRGKVRVPFEPLPGTIGVLLRSRAAREADESKQKRLRLPKRAETIRAGGNFEKSGIVIVRVNAGDDDAGEAIRALDQPGEVETAGAVVRLSEDHASFLTGLVIAKFYPHVGEETVARLAERHGLRPEGRFGDLGNIHRLRFAGPASYQMLEAANALNGEPEVAWAEPDLASTSEEDAVIPTDFLFAEQWDHPLINTPDAWQALRDMDMTRTFGSPDIVVAVVDNGIDATHPELSGNVSNGSAKQVALFDFANMVGNMSNLSTTADQRDHGTACASASVGNTNNASAVAGTNEGIAGVAGNCRLIGILRPGTEARYAELYLWAAGFNANSTTAGFPAQLARGADVITNSFGFSIDNPISGVMSATFDRLTDDGRDGSGVLLFFSAGNDAVDLDTTNRRPWSMYDRCFGVAASTLANDGMTEVRAAYSNFGSTVDWCAPSNDNEGTHNPPGVFGAHTATIQAAPNGDAICGHPARQTTLAAAAAAGAMTLTLVSAAGFAAGQAVIAGAVGGGAASGRRITAVNAGANQITLDIGLGDALPTGAPVVSGPRSYRTDFGGTSYATPVAAGVGALMLSANPDLRWDEVRDIIRQTAVKIDPNNTNATGRWRDAANRISTDPGYTGPNFSEFYGFGRIDAAAAVENSGWRISLQTPALNFNDVPEGETTLRAIRFDVQSRWPVGFQIVAGPAAPFSTPLGGSVTSPGTPSAETVREVVLWVAYTGTTAGATASGSVTVRNTQTGREWTVPITANTVERQSACVMLCLDRSGSMDGPSGIATAKRIDVLRFSAEIMIDVVHEGDGVGIVSFDHDPFDVVVPPVGPLGPVTAFDVQRDQLRSQISTFQPNLNGFTAIGDGVERAQLRLNPVTGYDTKSVIVFTDGFETDAKYIADVAPSITDRVFAVALGRAENIQPTALTALTNGTGGYCVLTGDLDINSRYKLAKYFLQVLAGVRNEDIVRDPDGYLAPGQVHEIDFDLTEADIAADIILMTPARGFIQMELVAPDGTAIDPTMANGFPGSFYYDGRNVSYFRLTLPAPVGIGAREGRWLARLGIGRRGYGLKASAFTAAAAVAQHGLPYSLLVHSYSNLRMVATLSQSGFAPGATCTLRAVLTEYGVPVDGRAQVTVALRDPLGLSQSLQLAEIQPGVFERSFTAGIAGTYEARFAASGKTLRGRRFTREAVRTAAVWIGGDRPPPTSDGGGKRDDKLCDLLRCLLSGRVIQPELRERLARAGLNVDALLKCVSVACRHDDPRSKTSDRSLIERMQSLIADAEREHQPD